MLDSLLWRAVREIGRDLVTAIDSQSVKIIQFIEEQTGIAGNKCINGRKRSIAVVDRLDLGPLPLRQLPDKLVIDRLQEK